MPLRPISKKLPMLKPAIVASKRWHRSLQTKKSIYDLTQPQQLVFKHCLIRHHSVLRRKLGAVDPKLQEQKVTNLKIAAPLFDHLIIRSGDVLSFWKTLGQPTVKRGFVEGMFLSDGRVIRGIGGGLCQLANLIYWMVLHTPLTVKEHHHHQLDCFPDSGRILPFGSGASVFFNYVDLQIKNETPYAFQLRVFVDEPYLKGEIWSSSALAVSYKVKEESHFFYRHPQTAQIYRTNRLYQCSCDKRTGQQLNKKLITKNNSRVLYPVAETSLRCL